MLISIVVVGVVVLGYVALTFPTRRRRQEWEEVRKDLEALYDYAHWANSKMLVW
jgi:hypothetical protein